MEKDFRKKEKDFRKKEDGHHAKLDAIQAGIVQTHSQLSEMRKTGPT